MNRMFRSTGGLTALGACLALFLSTPSPGQDPLERDLAGKPYRGVEPLPGELKVVGSRSMANLLAQWSEGLKKYHPKLQVQLDCEGPETALPELAAQKDAVAALGRPLTRDEIQAFEKKTGKELVVVGVCESEWGIIVHPENPLKEITRTQLQGVFGKKAGDNKDPVWGDLGLKDAWAAKTITIQGREASSGARTFFRRALQLPKDIEERAQKENPGNRAIVQAVAADQGSLGFCPKALATKEVKTIPIAEEANSEGPSLNQELFLVVAREKGKPLSPPVLEFLAFALSQTGQDCAARDGFKGLDRSGILAGFDRAGFSPVK